MNVWENSKISIIYILFDNFIVSLDFLGGSMLKESACNPGYMSSQSLGLGRCPEKEMASYSKIP